MKILLKEKMTGLWLQLGGLWGPNTINARVFTSSEDAIYFSEHSHRAPLHLCYRFEDKALNFEMPAVRKI